MASSGLHNGYNTFTQDDHLSYSKKRPEINNSDNTLPFLQPVYLQLCVIIVLVFCVVCGAVGSASVQVLGGAIPEFQLNAWRFGIQFLLVIPIVGCRGCKLTVPRGKLLLMGLNVLLLNAINVLMFTAYIYLPLGLTDGLMNAIIITGNALLSICIKSDRKLALYVGTVLCIIGLVLMVQPDFLFSTASLPPPPITNWTSPCLQTAITGNNHQYNSTGNPSLTATNPIGYVFAVLCSFVLIAYYHTSCKLVEDVDPFVFAFWNALLGTTASIVLMLLFEALTFIQSGFCIWMLLIHCVGTTAISVGPPWSLQYIRPAVCAMTNSLKMVIMVLFQYTILSGVKPGLHNWVEILGAVTCFCGMIGGTLTEIIKVKH